jgi:TatD DNase family protein
MIVDTHCHYNLEPIFAAKEGSREIWREHWQAAQEIGVLSSLVVGTSVNSSSRAVNIAKNEEKLFASVGVHPYRVTEFLGKRLYVDWIQQELDDYEEQIFDLASKDKVLAIGEIGLDYFRLPEIVEVREQIIETQKQLFRSQLQIAKKLSLPVILHVRDKNIPEEAEENNAYWDTLKIIGYYLDEQHPIILHCASGPLEYIKQFLKRNCYIGVAGNVTYPSATHIREIVKLAPKDRILLETDAPYLPPQDYRGKSCEPKMIVQTATYLDSELRLSREQILNNTKLILPSLIG